MLTRRSFGLSSLSWLPHWLPAVSRAESNEAFHVRIRTDQTVEGVLPPIVLQELNISEDQSPSAQELASRAPAGRAAPLLVIIAGALAINEIAQLIKEMVREFYYGGVIIDGRQSPPEISNSPKIPANMVFVFLPDGKLQQFKSGNVPLDVLVSALRGKG